MPFIPGGGGIDVDPSSGSVSATGHLTAGVDARSTTIPCNAQASGFPDPALVGMYQAIIGTLTGAETVTVTAITSTTLTVLRDPDNVKTHLTNAAITTKSAFGNAPFAITGVYDIPDNSPFLPIAPAPARFQLVPGMYLAMGTGEIVQVVAVDPPPENRTITVVGPNGPRVITIKVIRGAGETSPGTVQTGTPIIPIAPIDITPPPGPRFMPKASAFDYIQVWDDVVPIDADNFHVVPEDAFQSVDGQIRTVEVAGGEHILVIVHAGDATVKGTVCTTLQILKRGVDCTTPAVHVIGDPVTDASAPNFLVNSIVAGDTSAIVSSIAGFVPPLFVIKIDCEQIMVVGLKPGADGVGTLAPLVRGFNNTNAAAHAAGTNVYLLGKVKVVQEGSLPRPSGRTGSPGESGNMNRAPRFARLIFPVFPPITFPFIPDVKNLPENRSPELLGD